MGNLRKEIRVTIKKTLVETLNKMTKNVVVAQEKDPILPGETCDGATHAWCCWKKFTISFFD